MSLTIWAFLNRKNDYDCDVNCKWKHPLSKKKRRKCEAIKKKACKCYDLGDKRLIAPCVSSMHSDNPPKNSKEFLDRIGQQRLYDEYGIIHDGFQIEDSSSFQTRQAKENFNEQKKMSDLTIFLIIAGIGLGTAFLIWLINKSFK